MQVGFNQRNAFDSFVLIINVSNVNYHLYVIVLAGHFDQRHCSSIKVTYLLDKMEVRLIVINNESRLHRLLNRP